MQRDSSLYASVFSPVKDYSVFVLGQVMIIMMMMTTMTMVIVTIMIVIIIIVIIVIIIIMRLYGLLIQTDKYAV